MADDVFRAIDQRPTEKHGYVPPASPLAADTSRQPATTPAQTPATRTTDTVIRKVVVPDEKRGYVPPTRPSPKGPGSSS